MKKALRGRGTGKGRHTGKLADFSDLLSIVDRGLLRTRVWVSLAKVIKPDEGTPHWSVEVVNGSRQTFVELETMPDRMDITARLPAIGGLSFVPPVGSEVLVLMPSGKIDFIPFVIPMGDTHARTAEGRVVLSATGDVEIIAPKTKIGPDAAAISEATEGLVNGMGTDPYTGLKHWQLGNASTKAFGKK